MKKWSYIEAEADYRNKMVAKKSKIKSCSYCDFSNHMGDVCLIKHKSIPFPLVRIMAACCKYYTFNEEKI